MDSKMPGIPHMRYNITELVLELSSKAQRIDKLESTLEKTRQRHKDEIQHLRQKLQAESEQHTEGKAWSRWQSGDMERVTLSPLIKEE